MIIKTILGCWQKFILSLCLFTILAATGLYGQSNISVNFNNAPLKTVLDTISRQSKYRFVHTNAIKIDGYKVTILSNNEPITKLFDKLFTPLKITYAIKENQVVLGSEVVAQGQPQADKEIAKVSGLIVERGTGDPLPGVTVQNITKKLAASSDIDGKYMINVTAGDKLLFSSIGMANYECVVGNSNVLNIQMNPDAIALENVVVTGYYSLSKERSAGSFTSISASTLAQKSSESVIKRLEGQVPGLTMGKNGYLLRGASSINSSREPLIVVDGIPIDMSTFENSVSPEDVSSVSVLKDATASSIWGAKAANGVIVITTKRGTFDKKLAISYTGSVQIQGKPDLDYLNNLDAREYVDFAVGVYDPKFNYENVLSNYGKITPIERALYDNQRGALNESDLNLYLDKLRNSDNKQQIKDNLFRNKVMHQHNVKLSGGSEKNAYMFSVDYRSSNPQQIGISDERIIVDLKNDYKVTKWLNFSAGINMTTGSYRAKGTPKSIGMIPYESILNEDGSNRSLLHTIYSDESYAYTAAELTKRNMATYDYKMLDEINKESTKSSTFNVRLNAGLEVKIVKGLVFESRFQYQKGNGKSETLVDQDSYEVLNLRASQTANVDNSVSRIPQGAILNQTNNNSFDWTVRNQLKYDAVINEKHSLNFLAGTEVRKVFNSTNNRMYYGYNPDNKSFQSMDEAALRKGFPGGQITYPMSETSVFFNNFGSGFSDSDRRYFSLYANGAYDYCGRYVINASVRMDQANLFGTGVRYKPIWSVGAVWNITKEKFFKSDVINNLALRASRGIAGNTPNSSIGGPFDIVQFGISSNIYFAETQKGGNISSPALKNLKWEKTNITNVGIDYSVLNNTISGSIEYYYKNSIDLIGKETIDPTNGFATVNTNIGKMKNSGVEIVINTTNFARKNFRWTTSFNFSYNDNKITDIYADPQISNYVSRYYPSFIQDYAAFSVFSYNWAGLNDQGEPMVYNAKGEPVLKSMNDPEALVYSGSTQAPYTGGLNNALTYKNLSFSFQFTYSFGSKIRSDVSGSNSNSGRLLYGTSNPWINSVHKDMLNAWQKPGDEAITNTPKWLGIGQTRYDHSYYSCADINIVDGSYIALSDISLSYDLPKNFMSILGIGGVRLTAQIANPCVILFNKEGIDPRYTSYATGYTRSVKYGPEYSFKLNINF